MYRKDSPRTIQTMFNSIASRYDLTNAVLSLGMHKLWNHALVRQVRQSDHSHSYLDLCAGTGDIAFDYLKTCKGECKAYLVDFSSEMLEHAKLKAKKVNNQQISFIQADVQSLPLPGESIDCATMAYGIRNVQSPSLCLQEVYRVLKPGGKFGILELTRPTSSFLRFGHRLYLRSMLPLFGQWLTTNRAAYQYLRNSIDTFISPSEVEHLMTAQGFSKTQKVPLYGGIATILIGHKHIPCE